MEDNGNFHILKNILTMAISVGDKCPAFSLPNQRGEIIQSSEFIGKKPAVIYFYPKNNTGGCTAEACSFRDSHEVFDALDCVVVGISGDSISSHEAFAASHRLNFNILSDADKVVRKAFGVPKALFGLIAGRVTYVVDKEGVVRSIHNSLSDIDGHIANALESVKALVEK